MDTVLLIPESLSVVLLPRGDGGGSVLEMGATLWANTPLSPGTVLLPEVGSVRLDRLEVYRTLDTRNVRYKYGCYDEMLVVGDRKVRHCNWVRFLRQAQCSRDVNLLAERSTDTGNVIYRVISHVPIGGELLVHFDCDPDLPSERCLASAHTSLTLTREYGVFEQMLRNASVPATERVISPRASSVKTGTSSSSSSPITLLTSATPPALTLMTSPIDTAWQPRHATSPADHVSKVVPQQLLNQMREMAKVTAARYLSSPTDVTTWRREKLSSSEASTTPDAKSARPPYWSGEGEDGDEETGEGTGANPMPIDLTWSPPESRDSPSVLTQTPHDDVAISDTDDDNDDAFYNGCDVSDRLATTDDVKTRLVFESKMATTGEAGAATLSRRREKTWLPCDTCGKKFDRPSLLKRHMRTHTGEKPHACEFCGKAFSTSSSLNTHRRIHSGEKPHQCPVCGKRFTASSNLYYHRMTHRKEKPHKCTLCSKSFPTPGDLKSHTYVHSGSWPYKCHVCNRGFSKQTNLKNHLLLHSGDKLNECHVCGKRFSQQSYLKAHVKSHEDEVYHQCSSCHGKYLGVKDGGSETGMCDSCTILLVAKATATSATPYDVTMATKQHVTDLAKRQVGWRGSSSAFTVDSLLVSQTGGRKATAASLVNPTASVMDKVDAKLASTYFANARGVYPMMPYGMHLAGWHHASLGNEHFRLANV